MDFIINEGDLVRGKFANYYNRIGRVITTEGSGRKRKYNVSFNENEIIECSIKDLWKYDNHYYEEDDDINDLSINEDNHILTGVEDEVIDDIDAFNDMLDNDNDDLLDENQNK